MRTYTDKEYIELVEKTSEPILQKQISLEIKEILDVKNSNEKTFIDLGAGHGRVLPTLSKVARDVISVEINPKMIPELEKRSREFENAKMIVGDLTELSKVLENETLKKPVLLLLQNTLGTIEGDWEKVLLEMKKVAENNFGEIIISLFCSEELSSWGVSSLYPSIAKMIGNPDLEKTDFENGLFVSESGYTSKWRSREEIESIKEFFQGELVREISTKEFKILHIRYRRFK
ncbi:MAG: methyltransferase domain-containing protein [Nanoarchaeota archaeon]|nr:methyltransferase domain-containing protein [Nanoarchaeota archaeon]